MNIIEVKLKIKAGFLESTATTLTTTTAAISSSTTWCYHKVHIFFKVIKTKFTDSSTVKNNLSKK
jgi:hypothetical protein